jgi:hypothetical protein
MTRRIVAVALLAALTVLLVTPAGGTAAAVGSGNIPVTGTFANADGPGGFAGSLSIDTFEIRNGRLFALGTVSGTMTDALGRTTAAPARSVAVPVDGVQQIQQGGCQLVHLDLGATTLIVLGIEVALSPITLDVSLGGLLGTLLCSLLGVIGGAPTPVPTPTP